MKTKLLSILLLAIMAITGCTTMQPVASGAIVKTFCADVGPFNALVAALPNVPASVTNDLATIKPVVTAVCNNPDQLDATSLQSLLTSGFPVLMSVLMVLPSDPAVKLIETDITIAQALLPPIIASLSGQ